MEFPPGLTLDEKFDFLIALAQERRDAKRKAKGAKPECRDKPVVSRTGRVVKPATIPCGSVCRQKRNCRLTNKQIDKVRRQMPGATNREIAQAIKTAIAKKRQGMGTQGALYEGLRGARVQQGQERLHRQKEIATARKSRATPKAKIKPDGRESGPDTPPPPRPGGGIAKILTSRPELTKKGNLDLIPDDLKANLGQVQQEGVALAIEAMQTKGGFLNADGTGTGKTRQQLAVAETFARQGKKVLIVSPSEVIKPNWSKGTMTGSFANDSSAMGIELRLARGEENLEPGRIQITTYDPKALERYAEMADKDTVIIYDEAHQMKNANSSRSKAGRKLSRKSGMVMFATATPADKPEHVRYLERAGIMAGNTLTETFEWMGMKKGDYGWKTVVSDDVLHSRLSGLFDEMTENGTMVKRQLSIDGLKVEYQKIPLPEQAEDDMARIHSHYSQLQKEEDAEKDRLRKSRYKRITSIFGDYEEYDFFDFDADSAEPKGLLKARMLFDMRRQLEPYKIPSAVNETLKGLENGGQVVVFVSRTNYSEVKGNGKGKSVISGSEGTAKLLKDALIEAGIPESEIAELHGAAATTAKRKKAAMDQFQGGKARVIISTIEAGGTGINLDDTDGDKPRTLIMMTSPLSAMGDVQAIGRVARLNTKSVPKVKYLSTDTLADEWGEGLAAAKMQSLGATIEGINVANLSEYDRLRLGIDPTGSRPRPPKPDQDWAERDIGPDWRVAYVSRYSDGQTRIKNVKTGAVGYRNTRAGMTDDGEYVEPGMGFIFKDPDTGRWKMETIRTLQGSKEKPPKPTVKDAYEVQLMGSEKQADWAGTILRETIAEKNHEISNLYDIPLGEAQMLVTEFFNENFDKLIQSRWWIDHRDTKRNRHVNSAHEAIAKLWTKFNIEKAMEKVRAQIESEKKSLNQNTNGDTPRQDSRYPSLSGYFGLNPNPFYKPIWALMGF